MGDDPAEGNERTMWKDFFHASPQAKMAHENFHPIVWELNIFSEARYYLVSLPTYYIRGAKEEQSRKPTKDGTVPQHRNSRQDTNKPRK